MEPAPSHAPAPLYHAPATTGCFSFRSLFQSAKPRQPPPSCDAKPKPTTPLVLRKSRSNTYEVLTAGAEGWPEPGRARHAEKHNPRSV